MRGIMFELNYQTLLLQQCCASARPSCSRPGRDKQVQLPAAFGKRKVATVGSLGPFYLGSILALSRGHLTYLSATVLSQQASVSSGQVRSLFH